MTQRSSLPPASLRDLATRVTTAQVQDEPALEGLRHHLQGFRLRMSGQSEELLGCLDAAGALMRSLSYLGENTACEVRDMIVRLLGLVYDECSLSTSSDAPAGGSLSETDSVSKAGLRTINDMALGEVMVQLGLITPDQIELALREKAHNPKPFGETLVALGFCSPEAVQQGLNLQKALSQAAAQREGDEPGAIHSILLGELLIRMGRISRTQLNQALAFQKKRKVRIGAAMVALGLISWSDVSEAVKAPEEQDFPKKKQRYRREPGSS